MMISSTSSSNIFPQGSRSWVLRIADLLASVQKDRKDVSEQGKKGSPNDPSSRCRMFRVPDPIGQLKKAHYEPQAISFGLHERSTCALSAIDKLRLQVVDRFLDHTKGPDALAITGWSNLCEKVIGGATEAKEYLKQYDTGDIDPNMDADVVSSVLTMDAVFLMVFFICTCMSYSERNRAAYQYDGPFPIRQFRKIFNQAGVACDIQVVFSDIWLLQNQIPLVLIQKVWNLVHPQSSTSDANPGGRSYPFDVLVRNTVRKALLNFSLPFADSQVDQFVVTQVDQPSLKCQHLLECLYQVVCPDPVEVKQHLIHRFVSNLAQVDRRLSGDGNSNSRSTSGSNSVLTVSELRKSGIRVKGVRTNISDVKFKTSLRYFKATLYLPQIGIGAETEKILRNLCAYEFLHTTSLEKHHFLSYVSLLDDLIDTEEDVRILRKFRDPVIAAITLPEDPNKKVAELFNHLLEKYPGVRHPPAMGTLVKQVNDFCKEDFIIKVLVIRLVGRTRVEIGRFLEKLNDTPWKVVSLVAAACLLIMTAVQTGYTVAGYYKN